MERVFPVRTAAFAIVAMILGAWSPVAADTVKFPLKGRVFSASVTGPGSNGGTSVLLSKGTIGAGNVFVVQTWCVGGNNGGHQIYVNGGAGEGNWTLFAANSCGGGICCTNYSPGFVVPSGVDLMTNSTSNSYYSNVTGIIAKKAD